MKKILFTLIIAISGLSAYSQTLSNTTWTVYDSTSTFFYYFHFTSDILSYSSDNITFNNIATFQENGNNFTIIDLPSGPCPSDTGKYTFLIQNDTLKFTLISDLCPSRPTTFSSYHWINLQTGIQSINLLPSINIFPNPASDVISIQSDLDIQNSTYIIFDQSGRQVLTGMLTGETTMVDIKQLTMGIYFFQIGEKSKQMIKVMKK